VSELPDTASAEADGLELSVHVRRTLMDVRLTNRSPEPLHVYFAAAGPNGHHHDHLRAALLSEAGARTLRFTGDRNTSTIGLEALAPGEHVADELDLAAWALDPINGSEPLASGTYALTVAYSVSQPGAWAGSLSAGPVRLAAG
jgi:hypothetical protein